MYTMVSPDEEVRNRLANIIRLSEQSPAASAEWAEYWGKKNGKDAVSSIIEKMLDNAAPGKFSYISAFTAPSDLGDKSPFLGHYEAAYCKAVQDGFNHLIPGRFSVTLVGCGQLQIQLQDS
jgi:hypothetical protein